jgi:hypothetical protein
LVNAVFAQQRAHAADLKHATILEAAELGDQAAAA